MLLTVGRCLAQVHPEVTGPALWTRGLAADYVGLVLNLPVGQCAHADRLWPSRVGKLVSAKAKAYHLAATSAIFRDAQEWGWIPRRFDPRRCFAAPRSVRE